MQRLNATKTRIRRWRRAWARSFCSTVTPIAPWRYVRETRLTPQRLGGNSADAGEAYDRQGKPEQAYRAYSRAIEADPESEDSYIAFAEFASAHGNDDYALQVVSRGLEHMPESAGLLFEQGILWAFKGDRNQAENNFTASQPAQAGLDPAAAGPWGFAAGVG